jgi:predicted transcriptional regulator with HTH domain
MLLQIIGGGGGFCDGETRSNVTFSIFTFFCNMCPISLFLSAVERSVILEGDPSNIVHYDVGLNIADI